MGFMSSLYNVLSLATRLPELIIPTRIKLNILAIFCVTVLLDIALWQVLINRYLLISLV